MKTKNYIIETKTETKIKKCPVRWDIYAKWDGTDRFSRNEAVRMIRVLNLGRGV